MRFALACAAALWVGATGPSPMAPKADFYVATNGNDAWSGRLAAPNRGRSDGPFATIARAQRAVRERPGKDRPAIVQVRGGTYFLAEPLTFTAQDSGTGQAPVTFEAFGRERPILSGGTRLTGWRVDDRGWWRLTMPEVKQGKRLFSQLFVNGQRRYRPRLPKTGYYSIADALPPSPRAEGKGFDRFRFSPGEIRAGWRNLSDVEVLGFQIWTMARMRVESVDELANAVQLSGQTRGLTPYAALPKGNRYLVENVREALEKPGEFYLDRETGELIYIPATGENRANSVVIAPRLDRLVELNGASHLRFRGLTFSHTNWTTPAEGQVFPQAEVNLGGAISARDAADVLFDRCEVSHTGAWAVDLGAGCKRNQLIGCALTDLGAGGIKIGEMGIPADDARVASHNTVRSCLIANGGRIHPAAVGVWIGQSHNNRIERNEITDFYYTGVSVGWTWGYGQSLAHHNAIEGNHIHRIGQGVLSDMGGIYTLGISPGTVLRANHIHDVESFGYGGWGIYPDEGSTGILIEGNLVYRTKSAGFHQHYGRENIVRNNVFAFGREAQIMRTRAEDHLSFTMEQNIVYWTEGPLLGSNWQGDNYRLDRNLYWNAAGKPIDFAGMTLEQWRAKGQDVHSVIADPLFASPTTGDFRLRANSPAARIGFVPLRLPVSGIPGRPAAGVPAAFPIR